MLMEVGLRLRDLSCVSAGALLTGVRVLVVVVVVAGGWVVDVASWEVAAGVGSVVAVAAPPVRVAPPMKALFSFVEASEASALGWRLNLPRRDFTRDSFLAGAGAAAAGTAAAGVAEAGVVVSEGVDLDRVVSSEGLGAVEVPVSVVEVSSVGGRGIGFSG